MVIERGKRYGRTSEEVRKFGYPEDNRSNIKVENEIVLTGEEIKRMFPNQFVVLEVLEYKDIDALYEFTEAIVRYFKCDGTFSVEIVDRLQKEHPNGIYFPANFYDAGLEGDLLWY